MDPVTPEVLNAVLAQFDLGTAGPGTVPYGAGYINDTWLVQNGQEQFILQRINTAVFGDPEALMQNICSVTGWLRKAIARAGGDPARGVLRVRPTRSGAACWRDAVGGAWRVYDFIAGGVCLQKARCPADLRMAGFAFGRFQRQMAGYPAAALCETIPHFHDTPRRWQDLMAAAHADPLDRAAACRAELTFAAAREADCRTLSDRLAAGLLPLRVTHNDTKLNNVLLDRTTGEALCIIDLDTVMPGLVAYDFGDTVRFSANNCAEDEPDQSKVAFSLPLYRAFTAGFLEGCAGTLSAAECDSLPWGARLMTLECGMRFLTDYLTGDHYFKIDRPGQNLDRARTQFKLAADMEAAWPDLCAAVRRLV